MECERNAIIRQCGNALRWKRWDEYGGMWKKWILLKLPVGKKKVNRKFLGCLVDENGYGGYMV